MKSIVKLSMMAAILTVSLPVFSNYISSEQVQVGSSSAVSTSGSSANSQKAVAAYYACIAAKTKACLGMYAKINTQNQLNAVKTCQDSAPADCVHDLRGVQLPQITIKKPLNIGPSVTPQLSKAQKAEMPNAIN